MGSKQQFQVAKPPKTSEAVSGVLLEPKQTLDDVIEKVNEVSPTFTLLAEKCNTKVQFDAKTANVYSFCFALPHLVKVDQTTLKDDPRGMLAELMRTGVSFKNVSTQDVTLHANVPIAKQFATGKIYTRLSGFHAKAKKNQMTDDLVLKPGQTGTFKINWKNLANEYVALGDIKDYRSWINIVTFAVVIDNVNQATGAAFNTAASILEMRPKALYTKRKSNPVAPSGMTLGPMQDTENFALQVLTGYDDLYAVDPVDTSSSNRAVVVRPPGSIRNINSEVPIFDGGDVNASWIQDAALEGDLIGVHRVSVTKDVAGRPTNYSSVGLIVKRVGGQERPLDLRTKQGVGTRLVLPGFCFAASPNGDPTYYSNWKYDNGAGHWVLWDDYEQQARYADGISDFTPISTALPIIFIDGIYTLAEREKMEDEMIARGFNDHGQPYGRPRAFGDFLRKAISIIETVAKIAGFVGTLL